MLGGGIVLLNPELRCSLLGLCNGLNTKSPPANEPAIPAPPPAEAEEEEDDNGNPVNVTYNVHNPPPAVIVGHYPTRSDPRIIRYASDGCCECKTHSDGIVRCRTKPYGPYTISFRSAKYDVVRAASICARNRCEYHDPSPSPSPRPRPQQPSSCPTQISKHGRKYYLTNLTKLPIQTAIFPPTYIKEGRGCIYQLISSPNPTPSPAPAPAPQPSSSCNSYMCKTFPFLCPQCSSSSSSSSSNLALSLHGYKMSAY